MTLDKLRSGEKCKIKKIHAAGSLGDRLSALGLHPGLELTVIRSAPLKDPLEIVIEGYYLTLRKNEASFVETEPA